MTVHVDIEQLTDALRRLASDYELEAEVATDDQRQTYAESASLLRLVAILVTERVPPYDLTLGYVWLRAGRRLLLKLATTRSNA